MRCVANAAAEAGETGVVVVDGEVVHERVEQAAAKATSDDYLVGVYVGHVRTVTSHRVKRHHLVGDSPG